MSAPGFQDWAPADGGGAHRGRQRHCRAEPTAPGHTDSHTQKEKRCPPARPPAWAGAARSQALPTHGPGGRDRLGVGRRNALGSSWCAGRGVREGLRWEATQTRRRAGVERSHPQSSVTDSRGAGGGTGQPPELPGFSLSDGGRARGRWPFVSR